MQSFKGIILDATALIDFLYLDEWQWLKQYYSPLYIAQEVLDSDNLEVSTRQAAQKYLIPIALDTEELFSSFLEFGRVAPLLSIGDRSTIALARHQFLLCASDDGLVVEICQQYHIKYIRMLRLFTEMVKTEHKTVKQVKQMAQFLINERGKHISPKILHNWHQDLQSI